MWKQKNFYAEHIKKQREKIYLIYNLHNIQQRSFRITVPVHHVCTGVLYTHNANHDGAEYCPGLLESQHQQLRKDWYWMVQGTKAGSRWGRVFQRDMRHRGPWI